MGDALLCAEAMYKTTKEHDVCLIHLWDMSGGGILFDRTAYPQSKGSMEWGTHKHMCDMWVTTKQMINQLIQHHIYIYIIIYIHIYIHIRIYTNTKEIICMGTNDLTNRCIFEYALCLKKRTFKF